MYTGFGFLAVFAKHAVISVLFLAVGFGSGLYFAGTFDISPNSTNALVQQDSTETFIESDKLLAGTSPFDTSSLHIEEGDSIHPKNMRPFSENRGTVSRGNTVTVGGR